MLRWAALAVAALISVVAGYVYYEASKDQFGFEYQEEEFLSVAWAAILGTLCFMLLAALTRLLPDDEQ
jgi:hypothetical protein